MLRNESCLRQPDSSGHLYTLRGSPRNERTHLEGGGELDCPVAERVPVAVPHIVDLHAAPVSRLGQVFSGVGTVSPQAELDMVGNILQSIDRGVRTRRPLLMTGPPLYTMLPLDWACSGRLLFTLPGAPTRWRLCTRHMQPLHPALRKALQPCLVPAASLCTTDRAAPIHTACLLPVDQQLCKGLPACA